MGVGDWITNNIGSPVGNFFAHDLPDWWNSRPGPNTKIPDANRGDFNTPGYQGRADNLNALASSYGNRAAPEMSNDSSFRNQQSDLANRLQRQMNGEDSLSNLQLRQATDQNINQQRSLAAGASPGNAAMAQRLAMQNIGQMNQGFGNQAAQLGIQERNAAANTLGQVAGQGRGQDINVGQANLSAGLQQTGMNDQAAAAARQQELANAQLQQQGNMGFESNQTARRGQDLGVPLQPSNGETAIKVGTSLLPLLMAKGGIVDQPTHAIIGEQGPEAVVPLSDAIDSNHNNNGVGWDWMKNSIGKLQGTDEKQAAHSAALSAAQKSDNAYVSGVANVMAAYEAKHAHDLNDGQQSGLASLANHHTPAAGLASRLGGGDAGMGYSLMGQGEDYATPMMARGGIVDKPTRAIIGEAGPEAVVPLAKLPGFLDRLQAQVGGNSNMVATRTRQTPPDRMPFKPESLAPSPVSVVSHERDTVAEDPFVASAKYRSALEAIADQKRQADYYKTIMQSQGVTR